MLLQLIAGNYCVAVLTSVAYFDVFFKSAERDGGGAQGTWDVAVVL